MKISFISNYFNHHQASVSKKLYELTNGDYYFIATSDIPEERKKLGYAEMTEPFLLFYGKDECTNNKIKLIIDNADVVITGSAPEALLKNRKKSKKIIFRYSERPLKNGFELWKYPFRFINWHINNPLFKPIYMLCASAYTADDFNKFGLFINRSYKWGYFPECIKYDEFEKFYSQKVHTEILWCGRFLDWKHPDDVLKAAKRLKSENYKFHINIIGCGEMEQELKQIQKKDELSDVVTFLGAIDSKEVRTYMERAGIFLFTSDRKEGWGAVLNEAMNSCCAVIASSEAGATPYLVSNMENGIIYESEDTNALYENLKFLLNNPEEQKKLGYAAYMTITTEWNSDIAAERFIHLANRILNAEKNPDLYEKGPCSKA